jgi:hypothetical protein
VCCLEETSTEVTSKKSFEAVTSLEMRKHELSTRGQAGFPGFSPRLLQTGRSRAA